MISQVGQVIGQVSQVTGQVVSQIVKYLRQDS